MLLDIPPRRIVGKGTLGRKYIHHRTLHRGVAYQFPA
jgi:hypothetical protein